MIHENLIGRTNVYVEVNFGVYANVSERSGFEKYVMQGGTVDPKQGIWPVDNIECWDANFILELKSMFFSNHEHWLLVVRHDSAYGNFIMYDGIARVGCSRVNFGTWKGVQEWLPKNYLLNSAWYLCRAIASVYDGPVQTVQSREKFKIPSTSAMQCAASGFRTNNLRPLLENEKEVYERSVIGEGDDSGVLNKNAFFTLLRRDVRTLRRETWLNDEVINCFMKMIYVRSLRLCSGDDLATPVIAFRSHFMTKLLDDGMGVYSYDHVRGWFGKLVKGNKGNVISCISRVGRLLCPVHFSDNHWCILMADFGTTRIDWYDPYGYDSNCIGKLHQPHGKTLIRRGVDYQEALLKYLRDEHKFHGQPFELGKWTLPTEPTVKVTLQEATNTHMTVGYIFVFTLSIFRAMLKT